MMKIDDQVNLLISLDKGVKKIKNIQPECVTLEMVVMFKNKPISVDVIVNEALIEDKVDNFVDKNQMTLDDFL